MFGIMEKWNVGYGISKTTGYWLLATPCMNVWLYGCMILDRNKNGKEQSAQGMAKNIKL